MTTTKWTQTVGNLLLVIEAGLDFQEKAEGYTFTYPGAHIAVYREVALPDLSERPAHEDIGEYTFHAPQGMKSPAAFQLWLDERIATIVHAVTSQANPHGQSGLFPPDFLQPGIYLYEGKPSTQAYLVTTPLLREGSVRAMKLDLAEGRMTGATSVSAQALTPFTEILSLLQQQALTQHRPVGVSRRRLESFQGCLLGGAIGDALGACVDKMSLKQIISCFGPDGIRDYIPMYGRLGAITWHTQMALFTAEGVLRGDNRAKAKGIGGGVPWCTRNAYLRWMLTQREDVFSDIPLTDLQDGWLLNVTGLQSSRSPSKTVIAALKERATGSRSNPINESKGHGAVTCIAPVGLVHGSIDDRQVFELGCDIAAFTHGHPTAYLAAGAFTVVLFRVMNGDSLRDAIDRAQSLLRNEENGLVCTEAINAALRLAESGTVTAEAVSTLGKGWEAQEALAISLFCAQSAKSFEHGVLLAVNHGGASDATGAVTGYLLGALWGRDAIPARWLERLELRNEIEVLGHDLFVHFSGSDVSHWFPDDWDKYPGY